MRLFAGTQFDRPPKCDRCGALEAECQCPLSIGQLVRLNVEKRRKGKTVTVLRGLEAPRQELANLLSKLQSHCGAGGTIQETEIEIQGNHVERIEALLTELGYRVKR